MCFSKRPSLTTLCDFLLPPNTIFLYVNALDEFSEENEMIKVE